MNELTSSSVGRWLVTTHGSQHIWNIHDDGSISYLRLPGHGAARFGTGEFVPIELTRVTWWPVVGGVSFIWFDCPDAPESVEEWRQSSTIVSIEALPPPG